MTASRTLRKLTGAFELILGIPIFGAIIVIGTSYSALFFMLVIHIITLVLSAMNGERIYGSIFGIITSMIAWIPLVGMIMHIVTGILLLISSGRSYR